MKKLVLATLIGVSSSMSMITPAKASGVPTVDLAAIAQQVLQLVEWGKQLQAMADQLSQMEDTYNAIKGSTEFATILKDGVNLHDMYPAEYDKLKNINDLLSSSEELFNRMVEIKDELQALSPEELFEDRESTSRVWYEEVANNLYTNITLNERALTVSTDRKEVYEGLRESIKNAEDPKAKEDLELSIAVETLQVLNDLVIEIQTNRQMDLNSQNIDHNRWGRDHVIETKMEDVKLSGTE